MPVYVDNMKAAYGRMKMCHMVADSVAELLEMADKICVNRKWFQLTSQPHFDISLSKRALAVANGAIEVDRHGLYVVMKRYREKVKSDPAEIASVRSALAATKTRAAE